eukprot:3636956-Rhodomonas_salina.3
MAAVVIDDESSRDSVCIVSEGKERLEGEWGLLVCTLRIVRIERGAGGAGLCCDDIGRKLATREPKCRLDGGLVWGIGVSKT